METKAQHIPREFSADWIERLDGRTRLAQAVQHRLAALSADLGDDLSYQRQSLAKRAIWLEALIEQQEAALSRGEEIDTGRMTQAVNSLIGLFRVLGLDRVARDVPTLHDYLRKGSA